MTFKELAKEMGVNEEFILQKLSLVFGTTPDLENELTFHVEDDDGDDENEVPSKESFEDLYTEEELKNIFPLDEDRYLFSPKEYQHIFECQSNEKLMQITLLEKQREKIYNDKYAERRFQIICMYWYALWLSHTKKEEVEGQVKRIKRIFANYATNYFGNSTECETAFKTFYHKNQSETFLEIQKYFGKYKYTDMIYGIPNILGFNRKWWKKLSDSHKWKKAGDPSQGKKIFYTNMEKSLELLEKRALSETNIITESIEELHYAYHDELISGRSNKYLISEDEVDMIRYICTVIPDGKVYKEKLLNGEWEFLSSEIRNNIYIRMEKVQKDLQNWNQYIQASTYEELIQKSATIALKLKHPYCIRIFDDIKILAEFWDKTDKLEFAEQDYIEFYRLLENIIKKLGIVKPPRIKLENKTKKQEEEEIKIENENINKQIEDSLITKGILNKD